MSAAASIGKLIGPNVFITGANRGIGLGIVKELLKYDVKNVFASCRSPDKAKELHQLQTSLRRLPALHLMNLDVQKDEEIHAATNKVEKELMRNSAVSDGGINLLICNAGILEYETPGTHVLHPKREDYIRHFDINTMGCIMVTAAFLPLLHKAAAGGQPARILHISSYVGSTTKLIGRERELDKPKRHLPITIAPLSNIAYGMSKAALNHYTKALSGFEKDMVVMALDPGWVLTRMGTDAALTSVEDSARAIVQRMANATLEESGTFSGATGKPIPY